MPEGSVAFLLLAIGLLFVGHVLRAARHALLFSPEKLGDARFGLLLALSIAYLLNAFLPFRVGELARVVVIARWYRIRYGYVTATVMAERLSDLVVVVGLAAILIAVGLIPQGEIGPLLVLAALAAALIVAVFLIERSRRVRRWCWAVASIFNERLCFTTINFLWTFTQIVTSGQLVGRRYLAVSAVMWLVYFASYDAFSRAVGLTGVGIGFDVLSSPLRSGIGQVMQADYSPLSLLLLAYLLAPVLAVLIYGYVRLQRRIVHTVKAMQKISVLSTNSIVDATSGRFRDRDSYDYFLLSHFTGRNQLLSIFGLRAVDDAVVHKLFVGGSDAITALVEVNEKLVIRKFAPGAAGAKLKVQADWLRTMSEELPVATVFNERNLDHGYRYDMPYLLASRDFYDVIHSAPAAGSAQILHDIVDHVHGMHERHAAGDASQSVIDAYLDAKVRANVNFIMSFVADRLPEDGYFINGEAYSLSDWQVLSDLSWLRRQVRSRQIGLVHGDLTIENIIINGDSPQGWYIIDPNPNNSFDTPLIDWAKLMQSLNLGYESMNRGGYATLRGNRLDLTFAKSHAYTELHRTLQQMLTQRLGQDAVREIAFHELVNYLRLVPYKIRQNSDKGLTFFACTSIILRRYLVIAA